MSEILSTTELVLAAQSGDQTAFETLVARYRTELLVHCYRMLGSVDDAEDLVQETFLRAWEKCATLTSPEAYRAWLYRIATNLSLNRLTRAPRRTLPSNLYPPNQPGKPASSRVREPIWLEPFPDDLLDDHQIAPEDHALQRERLTVAFIVALQQLTPMQRAVLLLREVLEWPAVEVAEWLGLSVPAVNSALQRARRALQPFQQGSAAFVAPSRPQRHDLLEHFIALWERADVPGIAALLRDDAWFTMPPLPTWFQGRSAIAAALATKVFTPDRKMRLIRRQANGSPAFGLYQWEAADQAYLFAGLFVLGITGEQVGSIVAFLRLPNLAAFGLPASLS